LGRSWTKLCGHRLAFTVHYYITYMTLFRRNMASSKTLRNLIENPNSKAKGAVTILHGCWLPFEY